MSIGNQELPEFSPALRGYDRLQVDDYLGRLREYALELEERALGAEAALAGVQQELAELRRQVTLQSGGDLPPRLAHILQLAKEEAEEIRVAARTEADNATRDARSALEDARRRARTEGERLVSDALAAKKTIERQVHEMEQARDRLLGRMGELGAELSDAIERHRNGAPPAERERGGSQSERRQPEHHQPERQQPERQQAALPAEGMDDQRAAEKTQPMQIPRRKAG